jgi:hypothetical protein
MFIIITYIPLLLNLIGNRLREKEKKLQAIHLLSTLVEYNYTGQHQKDVALSEEFF